MSLAYRRATENDLAFVVASFLDSYKLAHAAGLICIEDWDAVMSAQFRKILARPNGEVHVAFNPGATEGYDVHGWLAIEHRPLPVVVYCYVKQSYRRLGIARSLFRLAGVDPTRPFVFATRTAVVGDLRRAMPGGRFNPLDARFPPK